MDEDDGTGRGGPAWGGNDEFMEIMAQIRVEFVQDALERTTRVADMVASMVSADDPDEVIQRVVRETHTIKGAAGTVGFPDLSVAAGEAERLGRQASQAGWPPGMTEAVAAMVDAAARAEGGRKAA